MRARFSLTLALFLPLVRCHIAPWNKGMYCLNGTTGQDNQNTNDAVNPLYNLTTTDWWMHHINKCDEFPPVPGDFLEVPANGEFTVELAENRAFTTFSYDGRLTARFGDGKNHTDDYSVTNLGDEPNPSGSGCIPSPNLHTQNETMAAGTIFAISYESELEKVTAENLVVFTVLYHTPFRRLATYQVPDLPACPEGGCHCVWGWVPNHCGQPNMYMLPSRCIVTGATSTTPVAPGVPPTWCENEPDSCVKGPKQMIFWNQLDGNNVITPGTQADGDWKSPGYNTKMGFIEGAQADIFQPTPDVSTSTVSTSTIGSVADSPSPSPPPSSDKNSSGNAVVECVSMHTITQKKKRHFPHRLPSHH